MIRVEWTETALDELDAIRAYLGPFNPPAAHRVARALLAAGDSLSVLPNRGRPVPDTDQRELVTSYSYIIRYRVHAGVVEVLRIRHTARRPTEP